MVSFKRQKSFKINFLFLFSLQWFVIKLFKLSGNFAIVPQFRDDLFIFISVGIDCEPFNKCILKATHCYTLFYSST